MAKSFVGFAYLSNNTEVDSRFPNSSHVFKFSKIRLEGQAPNFLFGQLNQGLSSSSILFDIEGYLQV